MAETGEGVEQGEIIEIASIHAVFMHVGENMVGCEKRLGEYPTLSARKFRMFLHTVEQVRRWLRITAGFTLLVVGVLLIATPAPGTLVILFGLGLLAAEFVWAARLMNLVKQEGVKWRDVVLGFQKK